MRHIVALGLAALSLSGAGCNLVHDATSLTAYKVKESVQDCREDVRNRKWAREAWAKLRRCNPKMEFSDDYAAGFEDGFAHYLYRGGNGEPPPLPPRHYRAVAYQTPQGYRAIDDWFVGFRHGAATARESGYRDFVTGPSAGRSAPTVAPPAVGPEEPPLQPPVPLPPEVPLPPPQPVAPPSFAPPPVTPPPVTLLPVAPPAVQPSPAAVPPALPPSDEPAARILGIRPQPSTTAEPPPADLSPATRARPADLPTQRFDLPPGVRPAARITGVRQVAAELPAEPVPASAAPPPATTQLPVIRSAGAVGGAPPTAIRLPVIQPPANQSAEARPAMQLPVIRSAASGDAPPVELPPLPLPIGDLETDPRPQP